ncbi:thioredoxin family protein [Croceitalea rosinachiae]|uniref:Thioredoxin family protein n=1 Tax=Croceitalea rosinachiae TaxID=3075596 RepID=A0ABU3AEP0_9FLAO|nr:thioredoxin family protein [Croceitalea sp. F388]MDT0608370.1 thioredoxin family protein [Croceitalea sp. F388]
MKTLKSIGFALLLTVFSSFGVNDYPAATGYGIGDIAADFSLKNIDGEMVSLLDFNTAKGFLVIFTCNTCPYSVAYEDRIIALDAKYKSLGVPVIAINPNNPDIQPGDSFDAMRVRAKEKEFSFPYLLDDGQEVYPQYGAQRTPHVFLLEKNETGNMVRYIGAIDDNYQDASQVEDKYVEDAVDAMLSGTEIEVTLTKAIGCGIKA